MSTIRRSDPFSDMTTLRDAMQQLFDDSVVRPARGGTTLSVPLNIRETPEGYQVAAVVPGLQPDELDITLQDTVLTIAGETHHVPQRNDTQGSWRVMEYPAGRFSRSIALPTPVNVQAVHTALENGILYLEIPKAEQVRARKITVQGRQTSRQAVDVEAGQEHAHAYA